MARRSVKIEKKFERYHVLFTREDGHTVGLGSFRTKAEALRKKKKAQRFIRSRKR